MTDIVVRPDGPVAVGGDRRSVIRSVPGGSAANVAAWLASLGAQVVFAGRVGRADHPFHHHALTESGVDPRLAADDTQSTGTLITLLSPDGERSFLTDRGANDRLCADDLPASLLDDIALLHVSGYALVAPRPRAAVRELMAEACRHGIALSIDPSSYPFLQEIGVEHFFEWTRDADMIFPNAIEAGVLTGTDDREAQLDALTRRYDIVVIKEGAGGAVAGRAGHEQRWSANAPKADAIDTTGAGDAFLAGFLTAHLANEDIGACLRRGVEAGSRAVTQLGGRPPAKSPPGFSLT